MRTAGCLVLWCVLLGASPLALAQDTLPADVGASVTTTDDDTDAVMSGLDTKAAVPGVESNNRDTGIQTRTDQDKAREAGRRGFVLPFGRVLKKVKQVISGDVVKVRLVQREASLWTYEVTVLDDAGHYTRLSLNARTGAILSKTLR